MKHLVSKGILELPQSESQESIGTEDAALAAKELDEEDEDADLFVNRNRRGGEVSSDESSSSEEEE